MTPESIQLWLQLGLGGLTLGALFLGGRRLWVYGWTYAEMVADRDRWRDMALRGINAAEKATVVAEQTIRNGTPK